MNLDSSIEDEILLKWFEMVQLGFPSASLSVFIGGLKIDFSLFILF